MKENKMENKNTQAITPEMAIGDVIGRYPGTVSVFMNHGLGCVGCAVARFENIRQGAMAHGINVDALMQDLNQAVQQPQA
jgi:hybrid cluster-associated redox disulfide protein